jgi:hypothetical protein
MPQHAVIAATTEVLTGKALGTFAGASLATVLVGNGLRVLLGRDVLWLPFLVALGFSALQAHIVGANWGDFTTYVLIVVNGFVLFFAALGQNQAGIAVKQARDTGQVKAQGRERPALLSSWL